MPHRHTNTRNTMKHTTLRRAAARGYDWRTLAARLVDFYIGA